MAARVVVLGFVGALVMAGPASAADAFGKWICFPSLSQMFDASFDDGEHRLNNLSMTNENDFISGAKVVAISASASNRGKATAAFSIEAVAFGASLEEPLFSISAVPSIGIVQPMKTEEMRARVLASDADFKTLTKACVRASVSGGPA